jgi:hypothetical protein
LQEDNKLFLPALMQSKTIKIIPRKRLVGVAMNLESLGNRSSRQAKQPKDTERLRRSKTNNQKHLEHGDKCRGGVCEVIWKPLGTQQSVAKAAAT